MYGMLIGRLAMRENTIINQELNKKDFGGKGKKK